MCKLPSQHYRLQRRTTTKTPYAITSAAAHTLLLNRLCTRCWRLLNMCSRAGLTHLLGCAKSSMVFPNKMPVEAETTPEPKGVLICRQRAQATNQPKLETPPQLLCYSCLPMLLSMQTHSHTQSMHGHSHIGMQRLLYRLKKLRALAVAAMKHTTTRLQASRAATSAIKSLQLITHRGCDADSVPVLVHNAEVACAGLGCRCHTLRVPPASKERSTYITSTAGPRRTALHS